MRFLADVGISQASVGFLRDLGYDAVHLREQALQRLTDTAILSKARHEGRVLLAHDLDFGDLLAASGAALPSVVIFRLRNMRPPNVNRHLQAVLREHTKALEEGAVVTVTEGRSRLRRLPFESND